MKTQSLSTHKYFEIQQKQSPCGAEMPDLLIDIVAKGTKTNNNDPDPAFEILASTLPLYWKL